MKQASIFQLTDCIEIYTRQHNVPERRILLYSYVKNHGKIEVREMPEKCWNVYYKSL